MAGTAVIEIFILPILLLTSGQISLVTVVTNLFVLPVLPIVMAFGFAATMVGYVHNTVALPIVAISNVLLEYILLVTKIFANVPFGVVTFQIGSRSVIVMYMALAFWLWRLQRSATHTAGDGAPSPAVRSFSTPLTTANLERLDNFMKNRK
jgi:predicted membrane metal-binding protein